MTHSWVIIKVKAVTAINSSLLLRVKNIRIFVKKRYISEVKQSGLKRLIKTGHKYIIDASVLRILYSP